MALDKALNLVDAKRPTRESPIVTRRDRLKSQIDGQLELLAATVSGPAIEDTADPAAAGRRRRRWWWSDESGQTFVEIRYARRPLELAKGKFAIKCGSLDDVKAALATVKADVAAGHLDSGLTKVAGEVRAGFKRS